MKKDIPVKVFSSPTSWRAWLAKQHTKSDGVWIRIYKKGLGKKTVTYAHALDDALCFGWIDGQKKSYDSESFLQRFTRRRPKSMWSKRNRDHISRLIKEKRMTDTGLREVNTAKKDGRWDRAYDGSSSMQMPKDFLKALAKNKKASAFFKTLNKANTYAIAWRLQTAKKAQTREKRMKSLLEMMYEGKKIH